MLCWIDRVWSSKNVCVVRVISVHLNVPSIGFVVLCMSEMMSSLKSLITYVFSPHVVSLCDFAYYVVG